MRAYALALSISVVVVGCDKPSKQTRDDSRWRAPISAQAPRCAIRIAPPYGVHDYPLIGDTLRDFAKAHGLQERKLESKNERYSGPELLQSVYENKQFAIWCWETTKFFVGPRTTNYVVGEFQQLTNSIIVAFKVVFPGRVEVEPP